MQYYEVWIADGNYQANDALTYSFEGRLLADGSVVTVPLRNRMVTGFVARKVNRPKFSVKQVKAVVSSTPLPKHYEALAQWAAGYWAANLGDVLRQFGPSQTVKRVAKNVEAEQAQQIRFGDFEAGPLTSTQRAAVKTIRESTQRTLLLHGVTGAGKTRVYLELTQEQLQSGNSVLLLTPEISLTSQLALASAKLLGQDPLVFHSALTPAIRKKLWRHVLEASSPKLIIGPRSALFLPIHNLGLIIVDEAHEGAYKQDQVPRYNALRVASKLAALTDSKVILGSATPLVSDYYVASRKQAIITMQETAKKSDDSLQIDVIDSRKRELFSLHPYISEPLINAIKEALEQKRQILLFLNRRGTARLVACEQCGWQLLCPHCDIPLTYHGDTHQGVCHSCGQTAKPPTICPQCNSANVIYKGIGTKALEAAIKGLFPQAHVERYDSDNTAEERIERRYEAVVNGEVDIIIGTQLIAKGLDLPKLALVGVVVADSGLWMPDYTADERTYQLLTQVIGRVGRGHGDSRVVMQTYQPESPLITAAVNRDWEAFYTATLAERQQYRFPPFSYLLKLVCRRKTLAGAQKAAIQLVTEFRAKTAGQNIEVIGPMPSFREKRGQYYYWQVVCKAKDRSVLQLLAEDLPHNWMADLDPSTLL